MRKKVLTGILIIAMATVFSGCNSKQPYEKAKIVIDDYKPISYETATVEKGNISPVFDFTIEAEDYESKSYTGAVDNLEVESVNVSVGDAVTKGTVLVSFKTGDMGKKLEEYKKRLEEDRLLLEHYTKLAEIDPNNDYAEEIKSINSSIGVSSMYVNEMTAKLESYNIVAERDGVVSRMSELLDYGYISFGDSILTMQYGNGVYKGTVAEDYEFKEGDKYEATYGVAVIEMELIAAERDGSNQEGMPVYNLTFKATGDSSKASAYQKMNIEIHKPVINDVLYVPKKAIFYDEDKTFVYVVDSNEMKHVVYVTVGSTVDGFTIITSGVSQDEKVVLGK